MLGVHDEGSRIRSTAGRARAGDVDWAAVRALGIRHLTSDSRSVVAGDTFVAYPGETHDGRDFIPDAISRGASSIVWERQGYRWNASWNVANAGVKRLRRHAGEIASDAYGKPSAALWTVGVTGTNGKTSCSHWIAQALSQLDTRCGVIGTLGSGWPGKLAPLTNTTPDAVWLHGRLREFVKQRAKAVSMEVSSHGLAQDRVSGVEFDVALFTNLTRDHLDYHRTMRHYRNAKARLFDTPGLKHAVVNFDDPFGAELAARAAARGVHVLGYGFSRAVPDRLRGKRVRRVLARDLVLGGDGLRFKIATPWGAGEIESPLLGRFNAANLLATLAVLLVSDHGLDAAITALREVKAVPGRMERFGGGRKPIVVVDYAHTPDALENVLRALRDTVAPKSERRAGKLVCVFGCGGDRDRGKRPLMGRIATRLADEVVITTDNPRTEDPHAIITDILQGITRQCAIAPDRTQAIRAAIAGARSGDVVLIAGKGHERYQEIDGVRHPYSDAAAVRAALAERTG
ncbi:MAG TPA: UDP-N-acetylmuramoyl-L-alanyl-D-glutamate--2,6-diaminopimelate ligase [Burkholderiales bacterium]|nr:UDP-N-acetylmuramoyl-L-alanyl-D-glutamate--2,6-diaminopimelate ligase [Burkholderiales bacterium]